MEKRRKNAKKEDVESLRIRGRGSRYKEDNTTDQHGEESILEDLRQNDHSNMGCLPVRTQPFLVASHMQYGSISHSFGYGSVQETS